MIDPKNYYGKDFRLSRRKKEILWKKIDRSIESENSFLHGLIEWRSFAFGAAAVVVAFFFLIGIYTTLVKFNESQQPETVRINKVYQKAITGLEKVIPASFESTDKSVVFEDIFHSKKEKLKNIDEAIMELNKETGARDYSATKQKTLRNLYIMKLNIIEEIIRLEETRQ